MVLPLQTMSMNLHAVVADAPPSYVRGRTHIRNAVARHLECSDLEAETRVDRLERTGAIYFEPERQASLPDRGRWCAR